MAEERTLGLARAQEYTAEEPSKQELQRRLDEARDSISQRVTEIKESVANQVQAVKETLDWREQFRKRPVVWSAGAVGVGFLVGYGLAAIIKGDDSYESQYGYGAGRGYAGAGERYLDEAKSYAAQPILSGSAMQSDTTKANGEDDEGPGFIERLTSTPAYDKVKHEVGNIGDAVVQELSKTAKQVVLPALMTSLRNFIGGYLPTGTSSSQSTGSASMRNESDRSRSAAASSYQPSLERNQT